MGNPMANRAWSLAKRATLKVAAILLGVVVVGYAYRAFELHQIRAAVTTPNGIDEGMFVTVGGVEQWVTIRGQDRNNPVLLLLHGGPGNAFQSFTRRTFLDWEREFTFVQWDQRGAGKTFGRSGPVDRAVTIERMVLDAAEVTEFVRGRLAKERVILVGLSWGSLLGVRLAKARPDLFYAYVGTGQVVNYRAGKVQAYTQLMAEARARHEEQAIRELEAIGPPPYDSTTKSAVHTRWANRYEPSMPSNWTLLSTVLFESDASIQDLRNLRSGIRSSEDHFRGMMDGIDLPALGTDFDVPFFVFQGALDNVAPVAQVRPYIDSIRAPHKELVLLSDAGHNAIVTKSREFLRLLLERVRPLASPS
jgi:pimeloyl-ACP methyl ester carboxylesterase